MRVPKCQRYVDKQLLESFRSRPCVICAQTPSDPDHIQTRGAGGDDAEENLLPLCRKHHTERHTIGLTSLSRKYPTVDHALASRGWVFDKLMSRWVMAVGRSR